MIPKPENVTSKAEFLKFLAELQADLQQNPQSWENVTLDQYLEAMAAWVEGCEDYYRNTGQPAPANVGWRFFAEVLTAARIYE
jgi:hypothetical protein